MALRQTLEAFDRSIAREVSNLWRRPELMWQQLYNRLQWEGDGVVTSLAPHLARRSEPGARPWMRTRAPRRESAGLTQMLTADGGPPTGCAIAPDGSFIASTHLDRSFTRQDRGPGPADYTLWIWDTETGRARAQVKGVSAPFSLSPDGSRVFAFSKVWNLSTGEVELELRGKYLRGGAFLWVPGRPLLVSAGHKSATGVTLWDARTGKILRTLPGHSGAVMTCAVSPDGSFIVAGGGRTVKVWDTETGELRATASGPKNRTFTRYVVSPDGDRIGAGGEGAVRIFDVGSGAEVGTLGSGEPNFGPCAFSPDGRFFAAADARKAIRVWHLGTGEEVATLEGHSGWIVACEFSPDGTFIVSASEDGTVRLWNPAVSGAAPPRPQSSASPRRVASEQAFAAPTWARGRQSFTLRSVETETDVAGSDPYTGGVLWPDASADRSILLTTAGEWKDELRSVVIWDVAVGRMRCSFRLPNLRLSRFSSESGRVVSPEGSYVVTYGSPCRTAVVLWEAVTGRPGRTLFAGTDTVTACAVGADETTVVLGTDKGALTIWDAETGRSQRGVKAHAGPVSTIALSPDGSFAASIGRRVKGMGNEDAIHVWNIGSGRGAILRGQGASMDACAISPDGAFVFATSRDRTIRVWNPRTGASVAILPVEDNHSWIAAHPWAPLLAFTPSFLPPYTPADARLADLLGIRFGPLAVPVLDRGRGPAVRCPACDARFPAEPGWIGKTIRCPATGCGTGLKVAGRVAKHWVPQAAAEYALASKANCEPVRALIRGAAAEASAYIKRTQPRLDSSTDSFDRAAALIQLAIELVGGTPEFRVTSAQYDRALAHVITCEDCKIESATWFGGKRPAKPKRDADRDKRRASPPAPEGGRLRRLFGRSGRASRER